MTKRTSFRRSVMRRYALIVFLLTGSVLAADDPKQEAIKKETAKLQGPWKVVSAEIGGKPDASRKDAQVVCKGDTFTRKTSSQVLRGTYKLDPTAKPPTIDVTYTEGPDKGKTLYGIYALEG